MTEPQCPSCRVTMDDGFVIDKGHMNVPTPAKWADGPPETSFWRGLKLSGKDVLTVVTYRCPNCGLLQAYARKE